jgi:hypothetical protein
MKDNVRRFLMFAVIVITGSVMIFADVALIYMLPLLAVVGFILLLLLGAITVADIKNELSKVSLKRLREYSLFKKLGSLKGVKNKTTTGQKNTGTPSGKKVSSPSSEKGSGLSYHLSSLVSAVKSLGHILSDRKKPTKKVEDINKMLDKTVSEKVKGSSLAKAGAVGVSGAHAGSSAGGALPGDDSDPFLSLSSEELDTGLLDSLDEPEADSLPGPETGDASSGADADSALSMPELPPLPDQGADPASMSEAGAEGGLAEFDGLEGGESVDDALGELDNLEIDDEEVGEDNASDQSSASQTPAQQAQSSPPSASDLIPAAPMVPPGGSDLIPMGSDGSQDMSTFAAGPSGSDEDMLSSLASEIKHVKKEKDISLLRELKDFKAPATDLEKELQDMTEHLLSTSKSAKKELGSAQEIK